MSSLREVSRSLGVGLARTRPASSIELSSELSGLFPAQQLDNLTHSFVRVRLPLLAKQLEAEILREILR